MTETNEDKVKATVARLKKRSIAPAPLTPAQAAALDAYRVEHGEQWRTMLSREWRCGSAPALLHGLRNSHGFQWLAVVK